MAVRTSSTELDRGQTATAAPRIWMLADDRPGNVNQALGLAEALGEPFAIKSVGYRQLARLPNWLLPSNLIGLTPATRETLVPPWPDVIIGAGRRTARIGRWVKQRHAAVSLVQLMWPGSSEGFDLIAVPEHDRVPADPVLMRTLGPPHRLTSERLRRSAAEMAPRLVGLPRPYVACLVGGTSKHVTFTPDDARALVAGAGELAGQRDGSLLVTTSRRTGEACTAALRQALDEQEPCPHWLHCWAPEGDNPYIGMLGSADAVVVSADSASMCAEACAPGVPVYLHEPQAGAPEKFEILYRRLRDHGCLRPLGSAWFEVAAPPPNPAFAIAEAIRAILVHKNDENRAEQVESIASAP
ncbi:MAG: mitochondrial fission ELM1 family protein [Geminicoccaceae bacterium]